ncbi:MAG TPA: hypothetical protein VF035_04605 [Longimicrobiales bacterium]
MRTFRYGVCTAVTTLFILGTQSPVDAQDVATDSILVRTMNEAVSRHWRLRFDGPEGVEGRISAYADGIVILEAGDTVQLANVSHIEKRSSTPWGSVVGGVIGAVGIGGALTYFIVGSPGGFFGHEVVPGYNVGAVAAGAVIGGLIGSAFNPGWTTIWLR